jgi:hypothetical protein
MLARRPRRLGRVAWIALAAALAVSTVVVAGGTRWFDQFTPGGHCAAAPACASDWAQVALLNDQTRDVAAVNVLVQPGLSASRLLAIAVEAAAQQRSHRVIVYVLNDLPVGTMDAGFAAMPSDDGVPAPLPPAALRPFLALTYDRGPNGAVEIWP